ncbi:hypothetical protein [Nocardioides soli]|uniref:Uncharacterized protein n=1 Tax=Nocardioides soli TaxID=1036020 RepID=A0A7W4Z0R1_9ACTN|nr:hypothetical protein [Nocardioides soli]MBB3041041.1 hypothetical protein [Nocardioides soli]
MSSQMQALREVMEREYGVTDTPTWDPAVGQTRPVFEIEARSDRTRRAILADLPPVVREQRATAAAAFNVDLDTADVIAIEVYGYVDRRTERADPGEWTSESGPLPSVPYERWLREQVEQHIPAGYTPVGRPREDLLGGVVAAKAAKDEAPAVLSAAVRAALERGVTARMIAEALGVTTPRVYQLRDGKR